MATQAGIPATERRVAPVAPRLNPFALPSETDSRFGLLIVSVVGVSLMLYLVIFNHIPSFRNYSQTLQRECTRSADQLFVSGKLLDPATFVRMLRADPSGTEAKAAVVAAYTTSVDRCERPLHLAQAAWMVGGAVALLGTAATVYLLLPDWLIRRRRLQPLAEVVDAPDVEQALVGLCREMGLVPPPTFLCDPLQATTGGLAFGRAGRYYVALDGGLITLLYTDPAAFRATMLHELSHLRNRDVSKTYFSIAVWYAFVAAVVLPFAVAIHGNPPESIFNYGSRLLGLMGCVYLTRAAVLRSREFYADARASTWEEPAGALARVLAALPAPPRPRLPLPPLARHPLPEERRTTLRDTGRLFRPDLWGGFLTGVAATVAFGSAEFLLGLLLPATLSVLGAALVFCLFVAGVAGTAAWRATLAALAHGELPRGLPRLGLGVGLGLAAGEILSLTTYALTQGSDAATLRATALFLAGWTAWVIASVVCFLSWTAATAAAWLAAVPSWRSLRTAYRLGVLCAGITLALWLAPIFYVYTDLIGTPQSSGGGSRGSGHWSHRSPRSRSSPRRVSACGPCHYPRGSASVVPERSPCRSGYCSIRPPRACASPTALLCSRGARSRPVWRAAWCSPSWRRWRRYGPPRSSS